MKHLIISAVIATASIPSFAWGDREQGILTGIVISSIFNHVKNQQPQTGVQPTPPQQPICGYNVYCQPIPQPPVCRHYPQHDYYGRITHYLTVCSAN